MLLPTPNPLTKRTIAIKQGPPEVPPRVLTPGRPVTTRSPEETQAVGRAFAPRLAQGACVAMVAPLGGGKTCLIQGICAALGSNDRVTSPTFILVNEYGGAGADGHALPIYHFDLYRLRGAGDLEDIGWDDYVAGDGVCLVEWADRAVDLMPADALWITIDAPSEFVRVLTLTEGFHR